jgi:hypothetical protein
MHCHRNPGARFNTPTGPRIVDRLVGRVAHESKAGKDVKLTSTIRSQIEKDASLIKSGDIDSAVWHFWRGVDPTVLQALKDAQIGFVVH